MKYFAWAGIDNAINVGRTLLMTGTIKEGDDVITPYTFDEGASTVFYEKYQDFIDAISNISST